VKGPNRVWSVDGHDKLKEYGFEIYGGIDGYSRFMLNYWVNHCNATEVAVMKFYLATVALYGLPEVIRSDKGKETNLMTESHVKLQRRNHPSIPFHKAYIFGKSTRNIRIESWWSRLISSQTAPWKSYFVSLKENGFFDGSEVDKTALQYLYMDEIYAQI